MENIIDLQKYKEETDCVSCVHYVKNECTLKDDKSFDISEHKKECKYYLLNY